MRKSANCSASFRCPIWRSSASSVFTRSGSTSRKSTDDGSAGGCLDFLKDSPIQPPIPVCDQGVPRRPTTTFLVSAVHAIHQATQASTGPTTVPQEPDTDLGHSHLHHAGVRFIS